jgi:hypothetical protein
VNDELAHQEEGLRFRTSEALGMNRATVAHYIDNGDADRPHAVWFDDVVISTERIGCASF